MNKVGIIGFGRFGRVLAQILTDDFDLIAYDPVTQNEQFGVHFTDLEILLKEKTVFIAVPIRMFKKVIINIGPRLKPGTTIIDVCSVKVYPANVMEEILPEHVSIIATHPLFGPDSLRMPNSLKIMMYNVREKVPVYEFWKSYFQSKAIRVLEMTPEEHDRLAAKTQGITHFMGRVLREAGVATTDIDTLGFKDLLGVIDQTCHDSWELFCDLQNFNPYTLDMIDKLEAAVTNVRGKILRRD